MLDPISTDGLTADDVGELTDHVRQVMLKVFHENDSSGSHQDSVTAGETKNEWQENVLVQLKVNATWNFLECFKNDYDQKWNYFTKEIESTFTL